MTFDIEINKNVSAVGETYASVMRKMLKKMASDEKAISLLSSSVAEPRDLLKKLVSRCFEDAITTRYQSVMTGNNPYLEQALAKRYGVSERNILCNAGVTSGLAFLYQTLVSPGGTVLAERPGFDIFWDFARAQGVQVDYFSRKAPAFEIDVEAVLSAITPKTRLIVLSNLHNPSGKLVSEEILLRLAEGAKERGVIVVVDEVYRDYAGVPDNATWSPGKTPNVIRLGSLTKIYGLSGLRCGWIIADDAVMDAIVPVFMKLDFNASKLGHAVAAALLEEPSEFDAFVDDEISRSRPGALEELARLKADGIIDLETPDYGCICFPKIIGVEDTRALAQWLVEKHNVYTVAGEFFGAPGYLRLGFAIDPEKLKSGMQRLTEGVEVFRQKGVAAG
ncbi:pyridoxal phosphate-dependent aminotransferase [Hyphococcus luteus]|uniref:Pyridoxal phosphate-dependent aminotransferase n=1 Tax=Hyphococcus luteus TaxID=2058213 RepID=A0A2S7K0H0_9PROT|nr:pyridoxal phosphate-dependent aminotransferase [Marinicaulis flavus]PQA85994.1 pyridoxal phosphate-dependent aminotransferase [Marinicaulis flavus]